MITQWTYLVIHSVQAAVVSKRRGLKKRLLQAQETPMTVLFRPARRDDARRNCRFFQISSEGGADYIWSLIAQPGEDLLEVGAARYAREGVNFSYENCLIAEQQGRVIGMMHSYVTRHDPHAEPVTDPVLAPYAVWKYRTRSISQAWRWTMAGATKGWGRHFCKRPRRVVRRWGSKA